MSGATHPYVQGNVQHLRLRCGVCRRAPAARAFTMCPCWREQEIIVLDAVVCQQLIEVGVVFLKHRARQPCFCRLRAAVVQQQESTAFSRAVALATTSTHGRIQEEACRISFDTAGSDT